MAEAKFNADKEIDELRAEVARLTQALEDAKTLIGEGVEEGAQGIRDTAEDISEGIQERWSELEARIADNPLPSALIAFGFGFLIARLLSR